MRTWLMTLAVLLAWAGAAGAQVAAPFLNPVPNFNAQPTNPAVLSWDKPSRIGAFYSTASFSDPTGSQFAKGSIIGLQAQAVGDRFALGATGVKLDADVDPALGGGKLIERFALVGAAVRATDWLSIGVGQDVDKRSANGEQDSHVSLAGLTLRLGGIFYLGAVGGKDTVENDSFPQQQVKRNLTRYGAGIHWEGASGGVHLEAFSEHRVGATSPFQIEMTSLRGGTLEVRIARVAVSFTTHDREDTNQSTGVVNLQQKIKSAQIAYVPQQGLALSIGSTRLNGQGGGPAKGTFNSVGLAYLF